MALDAAAVLVLGPLQLRPADPPAAGSPALGGDRPRVLLAVLLARPNQAVGRDELVAEMWGEHPPRTAVDTLHTYVSRLRRAIAGSPVTIRTASAGYAADVDHRLLDATRFTELSARGHQALRRGDAARAVDLLDRALRLWRGPAYGDVARGPLLDAAAHRLEELRLQALEDLVDARLATGDAAAVTTELDTLTRAHPLRERLHGQRVLALYRCGRQADALAAFAAARAVLVEELGIEPGPQLRELHRRVLAQDPALDLPLSPAEPAGPDEGPPVPARTVPEVLALARRVLDTATVEGAYPLGYLRAVGQLARACGDHATARDLMNRGLLDDAASLSGVERESRHGHARLEVGRPSRGGRG